MKPYILPILALLVLSFSEVCYSTLIKRATGQQGTNASLASGAGSNENDLKIEAIYSKYEYRFETVKTKEALGPLVDDLSRELVTLGKENPKIAAEFCKRYYEQSQKLSDNDGKSTNVNFITKVARKVYLGLGPSGKEFLEALPTAMQERVQNDAPRIVSSISAVISAVGVYLFIM